MSPRADAKVGVGVEGISDKVFWDNVLHRAFPDRRFNVHNMKTREKLVSRAGELLGTFRDLHYSAGIIILDRDKGKCADAKTVRGEFDAEVRKEMSKPLEGRYLHLCIAVRKIESWYLADRKAVLTLLPAADYDLPEDTFIWGVGKLEKLWRKQHGANASLNKPDFAQNIAPLFSVERAAKHSRSLRVGWERIRLAAQR